MSVFRAQNYFDTPGTSEEPREPPGLSASGNDFTFPVLRPPWALHAETILLLSNSSTELTEGNRVTCKQTGMLAAETTSACMWIPRSSEETMRCKNYS